MAQVVKRPTNFEIGFLFPYSRFKFLAVDGTTVSKTFKFEQQHVSKKSFVLFPPFSTLRVGRSNLAPPLSLSLSLSLSLACPRSQNHLVNSLRLHFQILVVCPAILQKVYLYK